MKKAVLFDMDGTLTNTSVDIWENVNFRIASICLSRDAP